MSVATLYTDNSLRSTCYCPGKEVKTLQVAGKMQKIECRNYTKEGLMIELVSTVSMTELFDKRLIQLKNIGVDGKEFTTDNTMDFDTQSEGTGGLTKYECGVDFQPPKILKHTKIGDTSLVYIHASVCTNQFISTELQELAFPNDRYRDGTLYPSAFTDAMVMAGRKRTAIDINKTDIIGVFKGSTKGASHYDGILAQAYWAYVGNAYFHSVQFTIDETVLIDGTFLHAKYVGSEISIEFDSTQVTDASIERYQTRAEVYARLVQWLNELVTVAGDKMVDASLYQNIVTVTSKWTAEWLQLVMTIDADAQVNWLNCVTFVGIDREVLQGVMPIDERPFLVKKRIYTPDNILSALPTDIHNAIRPMKDEWLRMGQTWALYIDPKLLSDYDFARSLPTANVSQGRYMDRFGENIYPLSALDNTGFWFVTAIDASGVNPELRNVKHLVDSVRAETPSIQVDPHCRNIEMLFDQLHGVLVYDFRLFAANLLCSDFVKGLKEPMANIQKQLPCYNARVRENMNNPQGDGGQCNVQARFFQEYELQNEALYALPNGAGGYTQFVLEVGDTLPVGALPVYQIKFTDATIGIPFDKLASTTYEYVVQFSDGTQAVYTSKDIIVTFYGDLGGESFNVIQTVTVEGCAPSTFVGSNDYDTDYPFSVQGACASLTLALTGRVQDMRIYSVTSTAFDTAVTVTGAPDATIDLSSNPDANDAVAAAAIINAYFLANDIAGVAEGVGTTLSVYSPSVVFVNIDPLGTPVVFDVAYNISIFDATNYSQNDGIGSIEVRVYCQGDAAPVNPTFVAVPVNEEIASCTGELGWEVEVVMVTKLGCTFNLSATIDKADINATNGTVNFALTV